MTDAQSIDVAIRHVTRADGNVLRDLGLDVARAEKAELALRILKTVQDLGLTQTEAAQRMGIKQPRYSKIASGKLEEISRARLEDCLQRLGHDLVLVVKPRHEGVGTRVISDAVA
jgi:predicted XRE-type DNA-binding protein